MGNREWVSGARHHRSAAMAIILIGFALRLTHLLTTSPHVDEYSSIWAAQQVLKRGLPILASGFPYLQGLLFTYLEAPFLAFGFNEALARLVGLLCGVGCLPLAYILGKKAFSPAAGLLAMAALALEPEAIIWGGRARMYALQTFMLLLALYFLERGQREVEWSDCSKLWLFALAFWGALLSQAAAVFFFPALVLALLARKGLRWLLRPAAFPLALAGAGVLAAAALNELGGPVSREAGRPFFAPALGWGEKSGFFFREFFWEMPHLPWTLLFLAGFALLLARPQAQKRLAFFYVFFSLSLLPFIFFVGESWKRPRYLAALLPVYFLIGAAALCEGQTLPQVRKPAGGLFCWAGLLLALGAIFAFSLPSAWDAAHKFEPGYDAAFRYVRGNWLPGDALAMPLPAIGGVYLGGCSYYVLQRGYEAYLMPEGVDRWTGAPLLRSARELEEPMERSRLWFVVDDLRFREGYEPDFIRFVEEHMALVYHQAEVRVYFSSP